VLTASILARRRWLGRVAAVLMVAAVLVGCGKTQTGEAQSGPHSSPLAPTSVQPAVQASSQSTVRPPFQSTVQPTVQSPVQTPVQPSGSVPLIAPGLDLSAGPVVVPLELRIPSIGVDGAPMLGVGITSQNVMDAPKGPIGDPVWQAAFWYRGSGVPGDSGTATIAGHIDDPLGRPAIFARIQDLLPGDLIVVHDNRSGLDISFLVTETQIYSVQQTADPAVLAQIYGAGPVSGRGPQPAPDGLSHLTLITCTGYIVNGAFDHRVVVYATRTE
jgi:Sortase domain